MYDVLRVTIQYRYDHSDQSCKAAMNTHGGNRDHCYFVDNVN